MNKPSGKRLFFLSLAATLLWPLVAASGNENVFGPETFVREKGRPQKHYRMFTATSTYDQCVLTAELSGPVKFRKYGDRRKGRRGFDDGYEGKYMAHGRRVGKRFSKRRREDNETKRRHLPWAKVWLNRKLILKPSDFSRRTLNLEKPVVLGQDNSLRVRLEGKPGTRLTLALACEPPPTLVTIPDLFSLSKDEAEAALAVRNLVVGRVRESLKVTVPTGVVLGQEPAAGAQVPEGSDVDLLLVGPPPSTPEEVIPSSWAGQWVITSTYKDPSTGDTVRVESVSDLLSPGDPVGLYLVEEAASSQPGKVSADCDGSVSDDRIQASCTADILNSACNLDMTVAFSILRTGDTLSGRGRWAYTGRCLGEGTVGEEEEVIISGQRQSPDPGSSYAQPTSSLLQRFLRHPFLIFEEGPL